MGCDAHGIIIVMQLHEVIATHACRRGPTCLHGSLQVQCCIDAVVVIITITPHAKQFSSRPSRTRDMVKLTVCVYVCVCVCVCVCACVRVFQPYVTAQRLQCDEN